MIQVISSVHDALAGAFPLVLLLTGAMLHTFAPHYQMIVEERVKDQQMTETEARRGIRFVRWSAPTMTVLGLVLSVFLIIDQFL